MPAASLANTNHLLLYLNDNTIVSNEQPKDTKLLEKTINKHRLYS